jgi:SAM-dependent methyltransferase
VSPVTASPGPNQAQAAFWEDVAGTWLASLGHVVLVGSPFGQMAMERLGPITDGRVLDIGCGSGDTTIELARRVGANGHALGVDIAPSMIARARTHADQVGARNVEFIVADVQEAPLVTASFDAAFSQFGVMFFEDPVAAFTNVRRLIDDAGICSFTCWQNPFVNEWMMVPGAAFLEATGQAPSLPGPDEPGPFSLSEPDRITQVLTDAGFRNIDITSHESVATIPETDLDSLVALGARVGPVRDYLRDVDNITRERVMREVRGNLGERVESGTLPLSAAAFVVRAEG